MSDNRSRSPRRNEFRELVLALALVALLVVAAL